MTAGPARPALACQPLFIAGPTAVGKSDVALRLAEWLHGEIISVDSMQVYRGMDIGTAKPTRAQQAQAPHHLIDVIDLTESFDAAAFVRRARDAQASILARGRLPIFCGGTGLYFQAFLQGLGDAPSADPQTRAALEGEPLPSLLAELAAADPVTFQRIDHSNRRRVIRAVEVIRLSGKPFSEQRAPWSRDPPPADEHSPPGQPAFFGLRRPMEDLRRRIHARVDAMFERGLVREVEQLLAKGLAENPTARQALGYKQVLEMIQGRQSLENTIELVKTKTRQFAKRQMTWFQHQFTALEWISLEDSPSVEAVAQRILQHRDRRGHR